MVSSPAITVMSTNNILPCIIVFETNLSSYDVPLQVDIQQGN